MMIPHPRGSCCNTICNTHLGIPPLPGISTLACPPWFPEMSPGLSNDWDQVFKGTPTYKCCLGDSSGFCRNTMKKKVADSDVQMVLLSVLYPFHVD